MNGVHKRIDWRHQYDPVRDELEGEFVGIDTGSESIVQQSAQDDADINILVRRFGLLGRVPPATAVDGSFYGDLGDVPDLGTALRIVKDAREKFLALPADLRFRFGNDPGVLWQFVNDPANHDEAVKLGLLVRREEAPVVPAPPDGAEGATSA